MSILHNHVDLRWVDGFAECVICGEKFIEYRETSKFRGIFKKSEFVEWYNKHLFEYGVASTYTVRDFKNYLYGADGEVSIAIDGGDE
jgi:hypothetical protein